MLNPIETATNIEKSFRDYIQSTFSIADSEYTKAFQFALKETGQVSKGPYLELSSSFETGATMRELVDHGKACEMFTSLEDCSEQEKEIKLDRPLYLHQQEALEKAREMHSLVVTTGTGSGKTECFLLPILDALLCEEQQGTLSDGVRAIIIYPMNALANDQIKRMRAILKSHPGIRFGLYNGNTRHEQKDALKAYGETHKNPDGSKASPLPNEAISREVMQEKPPHILITNYSMLEYMLLRPKDDAVFWNARLRYVILDEAHTYRGAMGIETSLLIRRLVARIPSTKKPQFILTSATLGTKEENVEIVNFAEQLCGTQYSEHDVIRSRTTDPKLYERLEYPPSLFTALSRKQDSVSKLLSVYNADYSPDRSDAEKIYEFTLHCDLFARIKNLCKKPITVSQLKAELNKEISITEEEIISAIDVFSKAFKDSTFLLKARYHFFIRTLEGAFATIGRRKEIYLNRLNSVQHQEEQVAVFEIAICTDCGRLAVVGKVEEGKLTQRSSKAYDNSIEYYVIKEPNDTDWFEDEERGSMNTTEDDFIICSKCGACASELTNSQRIPCEHQLSDFVRVHHASRTASERIKCPACGFGEFRRFYLGSEAATAVLGTTLFEQLPEYEEIVEAVDIGNKQSIFGNTIKNNIRKVVRARQFLCFSDSRSEAAFFATYMESSYKEFLRRRGIWHVAEMLMEQGRHRVPVREFALELIHYFESKDTFIEPYTRDTLSVESRSNAWIALLNEMYNARRSTGLSWMGRLYFSFNKNNDDIVSSFCSWLDTQGYAQDPKDVKALLDLLVQDIVYSGALNAGKEYTLNDAEREYIFYAPKQKFMILSKSSSTSGKNWITGWCGWKKPNGSYYQNSRIARIIKVLGCSEEFANDVLEAYWTNVLDLGRGEEFAINACDFDVVIGGEHHGLEYYICNKCGRITPFNSKNTCVSVKCSGKLTSFDVHEYYANNHYANLYKSTQMKPLFIREHTAQLSRDMQSKYQQDFIDKKLNALSCSTTFEMGVDIGSLETIYLRNLPPSPANYVQRAGRAGRSNDSSAFVLTFARLSSHDFTYYKDPLSMISGKISAPVFRIENEKIINRHIFSVAISSFLLENPDIYNGDDRSVFLNEYGYEKLVQYLNPVPEHLHNLLLASIPKELHESLHILDKQWVDKLLGKNGVLTIAVNDYKETVSEMQKAIGQARRNKDDDEASRWSRALRDFRASKDDGKGKRSLIDYLVRNNVLPKYGFPVDTVELLLSPTSLGRNSSDSVQLSRDLQIAIAEYAPGSEIVADGHLYRSRYIRKTLGKNVNSGWEEGLYAECPNVLCNQLNFVKYLSKRESRQCNSCHQNIPANKWHYTIEPRKGFLTDQKEYPVPMHRPDKNYKTDDFYIGDPYRKQIGKYVFEINGQQVTLESTSNDSLVVIGDTRYKICPFCGYADENELPADHKDVYGRKCSYSGTGTIQKQLSHDFKTDVAMITFQDNSASDLNTMLSVLYAMLEGLSQQMSIERSDIKGCLYRVSSTYGLIFALILYDAVAGGAGHVRRLVTQNGQPFKQVLNKAFQITKECSCDSSCYQCLRNYHNQKLHDQLSRKLAENFFAKWIGDPVFIEQTVVTSTEDEHSSFDIVKISDGIVNVLDYQTWEKIASTFQIPGRVYEWDQYQIHLSNSKLLPEILVDGTSLDALVAWEEARVIVMEEATQNIINLIENTGWKIFSADDDPLSIASAFMEVD